MVESRGIIYVATGRRFVDEALVSVRSVKKQMPDISIALYTDLPELTSAPPAGVDTVFLLENATNSCRDKIRPLVDSPYEKTLFLDTDTYLCEPIYDVFTMLDRFDIALAQAPDRYQYNLPDLPDCFTELNSGVIAFRKNERVLALLQRWETTFYQMLEKDSQSSRDQHSLRDALYRSSVQFFVLPPEYNFRTICPSFAGKHCAVKIIHGRHANIERVAARLNRSQGTRVFLTTPYRLLTGEVSSYHTLFEATANAVFERLPKGLQSWLSSIRARLSA